MTIIQTMERAAAPARIGGSLALLFLLATSPAALAEAASLPVGLPEAPLVGLPEAPPVGLPEAPPHFLTAVEGQKTQFDLTSTGGGVASATLRESPRHGAAAVYGNFLIYTPAAGFIGRDSLVIESRNAAGTRTLLRYEMRVLPRYLPIAGKFEEGPATAGLYDTAARSFILCDDLIVLGEPMSCRPYPVFGLDRAAYIPIPWPTKDGTDLPALFDPETGLLQFLAFSGSYFEVSEGLALPTMAGAWPLLGDWNGTGQQELAMVFDDGRIFELGTGSWRSWPVLWPAPSGDAFLWPVRLRAPGGQDALARVDPVSGALSWLSCPTTSGCTSGVYKAFGQWDFRRPLSWSLSACPIYFLQQGPQALELVPGVYSSNDGNPQTIPVKFPDDPPGGG